MFTIPTLRALEELARMPAADVKKLGWRGVMKTVWHEGAVVVTRRGCPEAVILPVEGHEQLRQNVPPTHAQQQALLEHLRHQYDERLARLNTPEARETLCNTLRRPIDLDGKVIAGDAF